jgi:predicted Zn-dependent peptidase
MIDRSQSPHIVDAVNFDLKLNQPRHFLLSNATPVYAMHGGQQEVMRIEWVFAAGNWFESKNLVAATTNFLLKNGTSTRSAFAINEEIDFYGASLTRQCYSETAVITLHCLSKHVEQLLPVVADLITEACFPSNEIDIYKKMQVQRLEVNLRKCDFVANRLMDELLYGAAHPYGISSSAASYEAITQEDLTTFYRSHYVNGQCIIFISGNIPSETEGWLEKFFGTLPFGKKDAGHIMHAVAAASEKKHHVINDTNGVQGAIRIGRHFPDRHHADFAKVLVLNNILGGYFGSRLMSNIREDKGYTYGIHSYLQPHKQQSAWIISTEAGREVSQSTIDEIYKEMALLRQEPPDDEELYLVRNYMMGSLLGDLDGPFQQMSRWKTYILNDLPHDYFTASIETIKNISGEELMALANKYLTPESFYELLVI